MIKKSNRHRKIFKPSERQCVTLQIGARQRQPYGHLLRLSCAFCERELLSLLTIYNFLNSQAMTIVLTICIKSITEKSE